jgi:hypothetical protein
MNEKNIRKYGILVISTDNITNFIFKLEFYIGNLVFKI